jgi:hypothetical protein
MGTTLDSQPEEVPDVLRGLQTLQEPPSGQKGRGIVQIEPRPRTEPRRSPRGQREE